MKTLGIDIGTTTISAAVLENGQFLASETRANGAFIPSALTCAREQDVEKITQTALSVIETLFERYPDIHSIGVTGQMHGILYVDADGNAVQSAVHPGRTRAAACRTAKPKAGCSISRARPDALPQSVSVWQRTRTTLPPDLCRPPPPPAAPSVTTLPCGCADWLRRAWMTAMPASIGFFDAERCAFDQNALQKAGIDPNFVPPACR